MAQVVHAAGALVWRVHRERLEVLLIHRPRYEDWSWPKGKPRKKETLPACAVREVAEETGIEVVLGRPLPHVRYTLGNGKRKMNWYWAAQPAPDPAPLRARPRTRPAPADEVDQAIWVDAVQGLRMLTRRSDRAPLKALLDAYADGELATWAVLLTRHGSATKRSSWPGQETTRPLTPRGQRQARALVPAFAAFGAERIITSSWARCAQTVAPYAEASALRSEELPALTEAGASATPQHVHDLLGQVLAGEAPVIVCTHRPVLPIALEAVASRSRKRVRAHLPAADPYLRPGEVLVLHLAARPGKHPRVVALETLRPR